MNDVFDRLYSLFQMLGADLNDGSADSAEISAYSKGLEVVLESLDEIVKEIDVNTATGLGLSLFCELTNVDSTLSQEEKKSEVKKQLTRTYGDYKLNDIYLALADISNELTIFTDRFDFKFNLCSFDTDFDLKKLAKTVNEFIPPCTQVGFFGDGATFDRWDSSDYLFQDYDNLQLPFKMLDELT